MAFLQQFDCPNSSFSVVIDDDDRVAYAYLLKEGDMCGDVWLYNCNMAPEEPEWRDPSKAPFANPQEFTADDPLRITDTANIYWAWIKDNDNLQRAEIYLGEQLLAVLAPGAKPGWCKNARKDGPLAKVLPGN